MAAFVTDAMPDVDWINVVGRHWIGRETASKAHAVLHKGMFANSRMLVPEITMMREIAPDVIVETHINRIEGVGSIAVRRAVSPKRKSHHVGVCKNTSWLAHCSRAQHNDCLRSGEEGLVESRLGHLQSSLRTRVTSVLIPTTDIEAACDK